MRYLRTNKNKYENIHKLNKKKRNKSTNRAKRNHETNQHKQTKPITNKRKYTHTRTQNGNETLTN